MQKIRNSKDDFVKKIEEKNGGQLIASFLFTISRSLPIETNIWKGHKNKGEVSKNEGGISKMCVSPREK